MSSPLHGYPTASAPPELSVVIPAFNEEQRLSRSLPRILQYLERNDRSFEILVVDDGSQDGTEQVALGLAHRGVRALSLPRNQGKGAAVRHGMLASRGRTVLMTDADLSTPIEELETLGTHLSQAPLVVASRMLRQSQIEKSQPLTRRFLGGAFRMLVKIAGVQGIHDSQCGFKLFHGDTARSLFTDLTSDGFAFDVELLWLAQKRGHQIREVGVRWIDDPDSKVRPIVHSASMLLELIRFRIRHNSVLSNLRTRLAFGATSEQPISQVKVGSLKAGLEASHGRGSHGFGVGMRPALRSPAFSTPLVAGLGFLSACFSCVAGWQAKAAVESRFDTQLLDQAQGILTARYNPAVGSPEYYQLWSVDGAVLGKSMKLEQQNLHFNSAVGATSGIRPVSFADVELPDGRPGRQIQLHSSSNASPAPGTPSPRLGKGSAQDRRSIILVINKSRERLDSVESMVRALVLVLSFLSAIGFNFLLTRFRSPHFGVLAPETGPSAACAPAGLGTNASLGNP